MLAFVPWLALAMFVLWNVLGRQKPSPPKKSVSSSPKLSVTGLRAPPGLLPPKLDAKEEPEKKEYEHFGSKLRAARERGAAKKLPTPTTKPAWPAKPAPKTPTDWDAYLEAKAPGLLQAKTEKIAQREKTALENPTKL